jgi:hypothetical protein
MCARAAWAEDPGVGEFAKSSWANATKTTDQTYRSRQAAALGHRMRERRFALIKERRFILTF